MSPSTPADAAETLDASGLTVMPGAIDVHLHLGHGKDISRPRVPQDAAQETGAAASGGVTAFIPYLMATEPFETIFDDVRSVTEAGARIDFGYHFIISTEEQLAGVAALRAEFGAPSFKIFMNNRGGEGARLGLPDIDDGFLLRLCESAAASGGMVCPHPETIELAWVTRKRAAGGRPERHGRPCHLERQPPALRRGRRRAARRLHRRYGRLPALCRAHLIGRGARGRAATARAADAPCTSRPARTI